MIKKMILGLITALSISLCGAMLTHAMEVGPAKPTESWEIINGGLLYDNWISTLMISPPKKSHPAYPTKGKESGTSTWRCKECHGWDYKGSEGAYKKGAHYSGIKGIRHMIGMPVETIEKVLRNETHQFNQTLIPETALSHLAKFVSHGQIEMAQYIDASTLKARGSAPRGAAYFQTICAKCHGYEGNEINFKPDTPDTPEYIGTVARKNPWEALHKIKNGQPGSDMVSLGLFNIDDLIDILAYAQTLPLK